MCLSISYWWALILFSLLAIGISEAAGSVSEYQFRQSALLESEIGIETDVDGLQKSEVSFNHEGELTISRSSRLKSIIRLRFEGCDEIEPGELHQYERGKYSRRISLGQGSEIELRELYFDTFLNDTFLRVGKQQVVWGLADGLKVLDVVNPQSYREFILDNFDDSRIPLWMATFEIPAGEGLVQLLWIPDNTYDEFAQYGSTYAFTSPRLISNTPAGLKVRFNNPDPPKRFITDSDIGVRYSIFADGWDLTLNYLYHYYDQLVFSQHTRSGEVTLTPVYGRTHTIGGSASKARGDFTFRSELAFFTNRMFISNDSRDQDGIKKLWELRYIVGLDWQGLTDTLVSGQFYQSHLPEHAGGLSRDRVDTNVSLLLKRDFLQQTLRAKLFWIHGYHDRDGLVQISLDYDLLSNVVLTFGADLFYGGHEGLFGQFDETDRITFGFEWGL